MGFAGTFLKKFPAPSKISLRPHISCAYGNRLLQSLRQQIQDLRFKSNAIEILSRKTQCNCVLIKVLLNFFQKIFVDWGETPRSFSSINLYYQKTYKHNRKLLQKRSIPKNQYTSTFNKYIYLLYAYFHFPLFILAMHSIPLKSVSNPIPSHIPATPILNVYART